MIPTDLRAWQIQHYTKRLAEERQKQNYQAVSFLRAELHRLKTINDE